MHQTIASGSGVTTTLDIAALMSAVLWPLLIVVLGWVFRDRLLELVRLIAPRVRSLSLGGVSLDLSEAKPLALDLTGAVDLRHAGQSGNLSDSTLQSFLSHVQDPSRLDYAVVDLGTGREWLTSRLFILAIILARMRGLRMLVFVETAGDVRRRFVGVSECERVHWRLAMRFPWLEAALVHAQADIWPADGQGAPITSAEGRFEWIAVGQAAATLLLQRFLDRIQIPGVPIRDPEQWEALPNANPPTWEHAQWLAAVQVEQILAEDLNHACLDLAELHRADPALQARLVVARDGRWVALTRDTHVFDRLIDRGYCLETLAKKCVA